MKKEIIIFFMLLVFKALAFAQVILIPSENISYSDYSTQCQKTGYKCIQQFYFEEIKKTDSIMFKNFIEKLDFQSDLFVNESYNLILDILKNEQISIDELDSLIEFSDKMIELNKPNIHDFKMLKNKLQDLKKIILSSQINSLSDAFLIAFKTPIEIGLREELKKINLDVFFQQISYNKNLNNDLLVKENCNSSDVSFEKKFRSNTWIIYNNDACYFSEKLNTFNNRALTSIKENKGILIGAGLALTAILITNQYDLQITF